MSRSEELKPIWFSIKQREWIEHLHYRLGRRVERLFAKLPNGTIVEYTTRNCVPKLDGVMCDDAVYLGKGEYHHSVMISRGLKD